LSLFLSPCLRLAALVSSTLPSSLSTFSLAAGFAACSSSSLIALFLPECYILPTLASTAIVAHSRAGDNDASSSLTTEVIWIDPSLTFVPFGLLTRYISFKRHPFQLHPLTECRQSHCLRLLL
jgi:hypothetical protein